MNSITLGITYHNEKELLTQCLKSLFECRSLPDEVLIYDDCSDFPAVDYLVHDERCQVRVIRGTQNIMLAAARNAILSHGQCDYIHYQDADDLFDSTVFSDLIEFIRRSSSDLIINEVRSIHFDSGSTISPFVIGLATIGVDRDDLLEHAILGCLLAPTLTFRRTIGLEMGGYDQKRLKQCEDYEFAIRMLMTVGNFEVFSASAVIQRVRNGSMSSRKSELYHNAYLAITGLARQYPSLTEILSVRALRIARICHSTGLRRLAIQGVHLARSLSNQPYSKESRPFRILSQLIGISSAVIISSALGRFRKSFSYWQ